MQQKRLWRHFPCMIGLVFGLAFFCINITSSDLSRVPGDLGDARFSNYVLEHAHRFFTGKTTEFWNAPFIYPEKNIIAYSDNFLGTAPFYSLFRIAGSGMQDSFQLWFILMSLFNYIACYILLFYLFKNPYSAASGALIFAFSLALQSQISHAQLFTRFAIPLCILAGVHFLKNLNPTYFLLCLLALVYQFYCGIYLGFLLLITLFFFFTFSLVFLYKDYVQKIKKPTWYLYISGAVILTCLLLLPLMLPYVEKANDFTLYPYWEVVNSLPSTRSFFYAHYGSYLWKFLENTGDNYEAFWDHQIFPGAIAILSFTWFSILIARSFFYTKQIPETKPDKHFVILFLTGLCVLVFFIRYQDYSLYRIIFTLPGFNSMRALQRIINIDLLFFAIAFGYLCNFIFKKGWVMNSVLFLLTLVIFYLDNSIEGKAVNAYEKKLAEERVNRLHSKIENLKEGSLISYEPDTLVDPVIYYQLDAMISAQENDLKCFNGYTSNPPDFYSYYWKSPDKTSRVIWQTIKAVPDSHIHVIK